MEAISIGLQQYNQQKSLTESKSVDVCLTDCPSFRPFRLVNYLFRSFFIQKYREMDPELDEEIIDKICNYAESKQVKPMLQEYLKRLIVEKPADPIKFLIKTIDEYPYEPK
jgi:NAD(P)H-dependent flavin oxidoreductase YrpB (nitropropane dioxygenase family)